MKKVCLILCAALSASGCASLYPQNDEENARTQTAIRNLNADVQRLKERMDEFAAAREQFRLQVEAVRVASKSDTDQLAGRVAALETAVKQLDATLQQMRVDIVRDLSTKMADVMKAQQTPEPTRRTAPARGHQYGVQAGDTLSSIAKNAKISLDALLKANNMKSGDILRVGQKLVIPE